MKIAQPIECRPEGARPEGAIGGVDGVHEIESDEIESDGKYRSSRRA